MARGPKKHLKRIAAPRHWCLDKLSGVFAPRPSAGPHKLRECLPLAILLRNRLKYAITYAECNAIVMQKLIKVDGKVRTDKTYPIGNMDVISIEKTKENFRLLYNTKGRFVAHTIKPEEATFKVCKVKRVEIGDKGVPYCVTHDGRTIRYPHPELKANDSVKIDLASGKIVDFVKFQTGNLAMITGGHSIGRVGRIVHREKHPGSEELVHLKDMRNEAFCTKISNVFIIGPEGKSLITLPKEKGIKKSILEVQKENYTHKD